MQWNKEYAEVYVPDECREEDALARTTHLAVGAHSDDLEVMCWSGILACFRQNSSWFTGVTVTDGAGSSRSGVYSDLSDEEMVQVRLREQRAAALAGEYSAVISLMYSSGEARQSKREELVEELVRILQATRPAVLYTHNLVDKHRTHIAISTAVVEAVRRSEVVPEEFYGCEVWRALDWVPDSLKVKFDVSKHEGLTRALVGIFDSQISGGKRYDLATVGRKRANATYLDAYQSDEVDHLEYAIDMMPLVKSPSMSYREYVAPILDRFQKDIYQALEGY